jgi:hypothetical protein
MYATIVVSQVPMVGGVLCRAIISPSACGLDTLYILLTEFPRRLELCAPEIIVYYGSSSRYPRKGGFPAKDAPSSYPGNSGRGMFEESQHAATKPSNKTLAPKD